MTDPHPQERCGHFEVCLTVHSRRLHPGICPFDERPQNSKTGKCRHDTRTHTPAAPATPNNFPTVNRREDGELTLVYDYGSLIEHDAAIRKAEREQFAEKICHACIVLDEHEERWCENCIVIKSLRGGAP